MIIITGASRGIGKFLFEKYYKNGENIIGTYHSTPPDEQFIDQYYKVDISDINEVTAWIEIIKTEISQLTLVNCAGNNYNSFAHKADLKKWSNVINVNLVGSFNVIYSLLPYMRNDDFGRIINFSSIVAQVGIPGTSAYAASKSGLWGLARSIAIENATKGITINKLNLGYFDIGMITEVPDKYQEVNKKKIPTGEFGDPENIFNAVEFIRKADYMNGTSIDINAGLY